MSSEDRGVQVEARTPFGQQRIDRVHRLVDSAYTLLDRAIAEHIDADGRRLVATVVLFSGGNDSTVLAHLMRPWATHAAHANTGIGIEDTRQFVRDTCAAWDLPLIERAAPRPQDSYRAMVTTEERDQDGKPLGGFPGPGMHFKMYQRLKERALEQVRRELVLKPYQERIVFLAGRRRAESRRRSTIPEVERNRSVVWVSPLANWTTEDMNTYRLMHRESDPVPVNQVSDAIHMSGECLCGAYATKGEREEVRWWYPDVVAYIEELEAEIADRTDIPEHRKRWGWGADRDLLMRNARLVEGQLTFDFDAIEAEMRASESGPLCSSCDDRFASPTDLVTLTDGGVR